MSADLLPRSHLIAEPSLQRLGRLLDSVMTIDFGGRGTVNLLYEAAREQTDAALSVNAAYVMRSSLAPGRVALLATGFPVRPWVSNAIGETDGPPGAAALARALSLGLKAIPVVLAPSPMINQVRATLRASGVLVLSLDEARRAVEGSRPTCVAVVVGREPGARLGDNADNVVQTCDPALMAAIEYPGLTRMGGYRSSLGVDIGEGVAAIDALFDRARAANVPTMSFIDNVNEIGVGNIPSETLARLQSAEIAGTSRVDHLVVSTIANWGAYAVVAALAAMLDRADMLPSRERDSEAIAAVLASGGVEGVTGSTWREDGVDAIPTWVSGHVVDLLSYIARSHALVDSRGRF